jgi:hypothetical protein
MHSSDDWPADYLSPEEYENFPEKQINLKAFYYYDDESKQYVLNHEVA